MSMGMKRAAIFAAGIVVGGAACAAVRSGAARKACISLVNKAIKLKEIVAYSLESAKENMDDIVAEAKAMDTEDEACGCGCDKEENN